MIYSVFSTHSGTKYSNLNQVWHRQRERSYIANKYSNKKLILFIKEHILSQEAIRVSQVSAHHRNIGPSLFLVIYRDYPIYQAM